MARWANARKVLKDMKVLEGGHVARDDLAAVLAGKAKPRHKWCNAMKRGGQHADAIPTTLVGGAVAVHGANLLKALERLVGRDFGAFISECEGDVRGLLERVDVPRESLDVAIEAAQQSTVVAEAEVVPYRYEDGFFYLNGNAVPTFFFGDNTEEPWFKAKSIHNFLGVTKIGHTMARVHDDDKAKLRKLIGDKGNPVVTRVVKPTPRKSSSSRISPESREAIIVPTDHTDLSAWYVNWSGFDSILRGSTSPVAKSLHCWSMVVMFQKLLQSRVATYCDADRPPMLQPSVVDDLAGVTESDFYLVFLFPRRSSSDRRTLVKLGKSSDVGMRRTQLVQDFPSHWVVVGAIFTLCGDLETEVHRSFSELRVPTPRWRGGRVVGHSQEIYDLGCCGDSQAVVRRVWARLEELRAHSTKKSRREPDTLSSSILIELERTKQAEAHAKNSDAQARKAEADAAKAEADAAKAASDTRYLEALRDILDRATPQQVLQLTSAHRV
jgi:hypothetical protein